MHRLLSGDEASRSKHVAECVVKAEKQMAEDAKMAKILASGGKLPAGGAGAGAGGAGAGAGSGAASEKDACPLCAKEFTSRAQFKGPYRCLDCGL